MSPLLEVHVKPRAQRSGIGAREADGRLAVAVHAPPEEGAANRELVELVADALGVAPSRVAVVRGAASRRKTLRVDGVTDADVARLGGAVR